uniref:Uncharacterized protein n=1 Tax=Chrysotila carterae TaxID=13221 RepID=A0A7S4BQT3_CHRCT
MLPLSNPPFPSPFRLQPLFRWVETTSIGTAETTLMQATRIGRAEFEEELRSTSQISLRRVTRDEQKAMRCYMRIDGLLCDGARWRALLARADACAARLQPLREALEAADAVERARYPFHALGKRRARDGSGGEDEDEDGGGCDGGGSGRGGGGGGGGGVGGDIA